MLGDSEYSESLLVPENIFSKNGKEFEKFFKDLPFPSVFLKFTSPDSLFIIYSNPAFLETFNNLETITLNDHNPIPFSIDDAKKCYLDKISINHDFIYSSFNLSKMKILQNSYIYYSPNIVGVIIKEITDKHVSEADFKNNFNLFFNDFPEKLILLDRTDNIIAVNEIKIDFIDDKEVIGKNIFDCFPKKLKSSLAALIDEYKLAPAAKYLEFQNKIDNVVKYYKLNLYPFPHQNIVLFLKDITSEKVVFKKVSQSHSFFNSIWEHSFDAMKLTDFEGNIVEVNKAFCHLTGMQRHELIGKPFNISEDNNEEDYDIKLKSYKKKFRKKIFNFLEEEKIKFKNSQERILQVITSNIYILEEDNKYKENLLLLTIYRDITELKKAEVELQKSEGLSNIGKMTAYISHELKSSIAAIKLNIDLLTRNKDISIPHKRSFNVLKNEISRLEKIMKDILQYSKISYDKCDPVNVGEVLEKIKVLFEPILNERKIIINNLLPQVVVMGVEKDIQTLLLQLIENSLESILYEGRIDFYVKKVENNLLSIFVEDTGSGISDVDKVFDPFYTTKNSGTGLGLAIAKKIIEQHNGYIKIESSQEGETVFSLNFRKSNNIYGKNISN